MPAVRWETLRQEAQALAAHAHAPAAFAETWGEVLRRYADRTFRPGQAVGAPRLPSYHLPPAVLMGLWQGLRGHLESRPALVLPLAEALWARPDLESHWMAARLLGLAAVQPPEPVLQRFWRWLAAAPDPAIATALLEYGTARLVAEAPQAYLDAVGAMLGQEDGVALGLRALVPLLGAPHFENLPRVLRFVAPLLSPPDPALRPELAAVLRVMARRWPEEVTPFLRSLWRAYPDATLAWLLRRLLSVLPPEAAQSLKAMLAEHR
ncbi:MAG TPA: hypothetical protein ENJ54_00400 [Chloroflexi bacterium]|nr:hypothetical protein [Chloroflexota bacterium]